MHILNINGNISKNINKMNHFSVVIYFIVLNLGKIIIKYCSLVCRVCVYVIEQHVLSNWPLLSQQIEDIKQGLFVACLYC